MCIDCVWCVVAPTHLVLPSLYMFGAKSMCSETSRLDAHSNPGFSLLSNYSHALTGDSVRVLLVPIGIQLMHAHVSLNAVRVLGFATVLGVHICDAHLS